MTPPTVPVLIPVAVDRPYTYQVPIGMELVPGDVVAVPLGPRDVLGVVWDGIADDIDPRRLRQVGAGLDGHVPAEMRRFVDWVADYTLSPRGMVLRMVVRVPEAFGPERPVVAVRLAGPPPGRMTPARFRVLDIAADGLARAKSALAAEAGVGSSVVNGLIEAGTLELIEVTGSSPVPVPDPRHGRPVLSPEQAAAAEPLRELVEGGGFSVTLLEGVTGSGKTEVYFEAVAAALEAERQVLVLVPEISLTAEFLERFEARFGARPAEWHSQISSKARERVWRRVAEGSVRVVTGARSALFLPFAKLGLVIVDEEHDPAYKQEDGTTYHARDMAVARGKIGGFPVILSSATPSVESRANAARGRYSHLLLPDRYAGALPEIEAIDMRVEGPERGHWLSPRLVEAVSSTLEAGEQALLFLNRRGYAPLTLCRTCGFRFECPNCSAWLVEHRFRRELACHHCGHRQPSPKRCPHCDAEESLVACGPGVERIAEEAARLFPDVRGLILSSDLIGGIAELRNRLTAIGRGKVDLIIGTQLVAKGHNFPHLALVGVIDADLGLATADPRAAERTFQLLQQVTGRAGRSRRGARGLIQTFDPSHPVMQAIVSGDREVFYARELKSRKLQGLPPFGRLAALIVSARSRESAWACARSLARAAPSSSEIRVLGPAEAPLSVVRGRHRFRLLVKATRNANLQDFIRQWLAAAGPPRGGARVSIDIDPVSFL